MSRPNVVAALLFLTMGVFFCARWRQSVREKTEAAADQRIAAESVAAVEKFLRDLPRRIESLAASS